MNIKGFSQFASTKEKKERKPINKRHLKYGSLATGLVVLFIAAVVLVNVVATMLFERFPISLDLTDNSIYSVSDETKNFVSGIDQPIDITIMATEDDFRGVSDYTVQCAELLSAYAQYNPNINVRFKDLLSNPDFVAAYPNHNLGSGDIIVEVADGSHTRVKVVTLADIIVVIEDYETYLSLYKKQAGGLYTHRVFNSQNAIVSSCAEQAITSALMAITDANPVTVCTLTFPGANESDVSGLTDLLDKNGYVITTLNIQTGEIPEDVDILVIPAPKIDYTEAETAKITEWLTNGGKLGRDLIYVASTQQAETPNLDALLYKYGLTVEPKVIYETNTRYYSSYQNYTFQALVSENYNNVSNPGRSVVVPNARSITARFTNEGGYNTCEPLVASSNGAVLRNMYDNVADWTTEDATERGSFNSVVLGRYKALNQDTHISTYTNVIAIGSELIVDGNVLSAAQFNNGDFFVSLINELSGKTDGITIVPKKIKTNGVQVNDSVKNSLNLTFAVVIPLAVLVFGIIVWVRRRHK